MSELAFVPLEVLDSSSVKENCDGVTFVISQLSLLR